MRPALKDVFVLADVDTAKTKERPRVPPKAVGSLRLQAFIRYLVSSLSSRKLTGAMVQFAAELTLNSASIISWEMLSPSVGTMANHT